MVHDLYKDLLRADSEV